MYFKNIVLVTLTALVASSQAAPVTEVSPNTARSWIPALFRRAAPCNANDAYCLTDSLLFSSNMNQFLAARNSQYYANILDYNSDGCSVPPLLTQLGSFNKDTPYGYGFVHSCIRHDFGYRNYQRQGRCLLHKLTLDNLFLSDLNAQCDWEFSAQNPNRPAPPRNLKECKDWANLYYSGVRLAGLC
ncbi:hypothetical protein DRE_00421 [Drechslerella stenobrocha 248]|uniref:Cyanovirin-N domain-containing protein n=1 Tax=Drechslerella stenobrocha 248 TaxID=1043628 RepID=W7I5L4_9PEZI|nr:hypothetical protein DRE_00421 [Drechslerella stenobrocha 248]